MKHPLTARTGRHPPSRHAAFVARLRHDSVATRVTPALRTLRRLRAWTRQVLRRVPVRADSTPPARAPAAPVFVVHPALRTLLHTHHASSLSATHHRATLLRERAVARLHTSTRTVVRVERSLRDVPPAPPRRVPMALARVPAAAPRAEPVIPRRDAEPPAAEPVRPATPSAAKAAAPAFALPAQELSRVTEHVIRQLDQRVLSYRERTGRT